MLNIALRAARDAGDALALISERQDKIERLDPDSLHTRQDTEALRTLAYHLEKSFPNHAIQSRINTESVPADAETVWLLEAMLGAENFIQGYPLFGLSLAAQVKGRIEHAVCIFPMLREEYSASRGAGAQLNGRRIRVDQAPLHANSLFGVSGAPAEMPGALSELLSSGALQARSTGCGELDLCFAASGRLWAGWHKGPRSAGYKAASLIFAEAGGLLGDSLGAPLSDNSPDCLFAAPKAFKTLVKARS